MRTRVPNTRTVGNLGNPHVPHEKEVHETGHPTSEIIKEECEVTAVELSGNTEVIRDGRTLGSVETH